MKMLKSTVICLLSMLSMGLVRAGESTLVIVLDLKESKTVRTRFPGAQEELKKKLEKIKVPRYSKDGIYGVRDVKHPHITLVSGIKDTLENEEKAKKAVKETMEELGHIGVGRIYVKIGNVAKIKGNRNNIFWLALDAEFWGEQFPYDNAKSIVDLVGKSLEKEGIKEYKKASGDHMSLLEVHSSSGREASNRKKAEIKKKSLPVKFDMPKVGSIWLPIWDGRGPSKGIKLFRVTKHLDKSWDFELLYPKPKYYEQGQKQQSNYGFVPWSVQ